VQLSYTEENYLKAILQLTVLDPLKTEVGTNELSVVLVLKPATVNDMLKKLKEKKLIHHQKYGKISLTEEGRLIGMSILRRHRLWETFLVIKLGFTWDEVHDVAEQLEHIQSAKLVDAIDAMLEFPKFDPHGDPIPTREGEIEMMFRQSLDEIPVHSCCKVVAVKEDNSAFLTYVNKLGLKIGDEICLLDKEPFDSLLTIEMIHATHVVSSKFAQNIYVQIVPNR
jgi:DtxR family Mn-dependent transcriptional regulator